MKAARLARGLLVTVFGVFGTVKLVRSRAQLEPHMSWVAHATDRQVKTIGALEVAGAAGVALPPGMPAGTSRRIAGHFRPRHPADAAIRLRRGR
jgi:hypothetical protein